MKIVLVWPNGFDTNYTIPISLAYLKSNLDNTKHDISIINCSLLGIDAKSPEFEEKIRRLDPDIVGVSCWSPVFKECLQVLKETKRINEKIITVMGGCHVTSYPASVMKNSCVDFIFRGESELSFPTFLEELQRDEPDWPKVMGLGYRSDEDNLSLNELEREPDLDKINIPDYDAIGLQECIAQGYRFYTENEMNAPIWVTRGCPYRCAFCSGPLINGKIIRKHSVEYMMRWIKHLYYDKGIRFINIIDDNFTFHIDYAKEFCQSVIDLNLKDLQFGTPGGVRIQRTDIELIRLMKKAGWEYVCVAPESGSVDVLKRMRKDLDPSIIPQKVKEIRKTGLKVHGLFIIGYPGETEEDIQKTVKLIRKCKFNFFFLSNFQPLPGTPVYDELVESGEITDGLLPTHYSKGKRVYVPDGLKGFNFPRFVLREYMHLALSQPTNIPYMFKYISPKLAAQRIFSNIKNMLSQTDKDETPKHDTNIPIKN